MNKLLILGAGGHGKVVLDAALSTGKWNEIAFLDDNKTGIVEPNHKIIGTTNDVYQFVVNWDIALGIGDNETRAKLYRELSDVEASMPTIIHSSAVIGSNVTIGDATVIMPGCIVNHSTQIGLASIVNTASTVDHDCIISDYTHIAPGSSVAGGVIIGESSFVGIGVSIINNIEISSDVVIGAGSTVVKSLLSAGTYYGVPAREIKK